MIKLGMEHSLSQCVIVTSLCLCTAGNLGGECVLCIMFS